MAATSLNQNWSGLFSAVHTPFRPDGGLNLDMVERQAEHLASSGVRGVFVGGTTGECHSLSLEERRSLAARWAKVAPRAGLKWMLHVGGNALGDCQDLAAQAQELGADAISAMAPSYFKPPRMEELVEFCALLAGRAARLPFFYYHIPGLTGVRYSTNEFLEAGAGQIPTLAGLKYSHNDLVELQECLAKEKFAVLFGIDEMLLAALALGVRGAVGSTYNYAAPLYLKIIAAVEKGDWTSARRMQGQVVRMIRVLAQYDALVSGKALMREFGVDCGPVRLPLRRLSEAELLQLRSELEGILEFS